MVDPIGIPWHFLVENIATALLIIGYLAYELRWGRGAHMMDQMDGVITVVLALAQHIEGVDDSKVAERLNGDLPQHYYEERYDGED